MGQVIELPLAEYVCTAEFEDMSAITQTIKAPSLIKAIQHMENLYPQADFVGGIPLERVGK